MHIELVYAVVSTTDCLDEAAPPLTESMKQKSSPSALFSDRWHRLKELQMSVRRFRSAHIATLPLSATHFSLREICHPTLSSPAIKSTLAGAWVCTSCAWRHFFSASRKLMGRMPYILRFASRR